MAFQITGVKPALTGEGTANGSSTWNIGVGQWSFPSGVTLTERATGAKRQASGYYINWGFTNSTACENATGTGNATVTGTSAKGTHFTGAVTSYTPYRCSPQAIGAGLSPSFTLATKGLQGSQTLTCSDSRDWTPGKISVPFSITFLDGLNASAGKATSCQYYLNLNFQTNKCEPRATVNNNSYSVTTTPLYS